MPVKERIGIVISNKMDKTIVVKKKYKNEVKKWGKRIT